MVVFGLGYGLDRLSETKWLRGCEVYYWGDIDTHGFGILDRLRATLPHAQSFLMDRVTLDAHRPPWGQEPAEKRFLSEAPRLTAAEQALFDELRFDRLRERLRLEQERVGFGWLRRALCLVLRDAFPVSLGHTLIVPRRHVSAWRDVSREEKAELLELVDYVRGILDEHHAPDGYNIGLNDGIAAGQTVMHVHVHVIPRYAGDEPDPRGGVRRVLPHKAAYWKAEK